MTVRTRVTQPRKTSLSIRIADIRYGRNWSITELARRAGIARSVLSRIENAHVKPAKQTLEALARAFSMNLATLLNGVELDAELCERYDVSDETAREELGSTQLFTVEVFIENEPDPHTACAEALDDAKRALEQERTEGRMPNTITIDTAARQRVRAWS